VAALGDPAELLGMLDRRLLTDQGPPGQGRPGTRVAPDAQASGLTRWANAVARVIDLADDPTTLDEWASAMGASTATVKGWCRTTRLRPKPSLDLARVLRAANLSLARGRPIDRFLAAADRRTLARLLAGAGLTGNQPVRSLTELLRRQRFIQDEAALSELTRAVIERGPMAEQPPRG
jgi:hypothetical protein